ncbi:MULTISPECIES: hypothetical protein [unclassified Leptolyngbya]|uniref:hypothetical protein n=1 Tax=unclassified Leptolyngbya TaxID=2650499 RepID=UPI001682304E|nr:MULTISPECIES: hypothetical protein [unclassified Leptolyngbya]MBD1909565.1 hypothetical protein [Leptolyngbya sp. FACHB-8]MBD2154103.1 hypothetical protein [Leptolyngbya sp. FACHB-16]
MKWKQLLSKKWVSVPASLAMMLTLAGAVYAQVQTPINSTVVVRGNSGGSQSSSCGFIPGAPVQTVRVSEQFAALRFEVQSQNTSTLLITGPGGRSQCARASDFSGGAIEVTGVWEQGTYSLFVGERNQGVRNPFTLSVLPE